MSPISGTKSFSTSVAFKKAKVNCCVESGPKSVSLHA